MLHHGVSKYVDLGSLFHVLGQLTKCCLHLSCGICQNDAGQLKRVAFWTRRLDALGSHELQGDTSLSIGDFSFPNLLVYISVFLQRDVLSFGILKYVLLYTAFDYSST
jgi:hypothetical protein